MIERIFAKLREMDDANLRMTLECYDPVAPLPVAELMALEGKILAQLDKEVVGNVLISDYMPPVWMQHRAWIMRAAGVMGILVAVLGFAAGRDFDQLSFQSADQGTVFASADSTLWQSFITAPSTTGEVNDSAE
jgi:hypothetical protein